MTQLPATHAGESRWPFWSMLFYGHFGADASPESLRADRRSRLAMFLFCVALLGVSLVPGLEPTLRRHATSSLVGLTMAYLAWQRWRYTTGLDELARRLYLEAFAITYLIGLALFSVLGLLQEWRGWTFSPLVFVALEPVRATVLAWRSRRLA